jgi:CRP/FNR family cyclic AMP-dependent transcriptional regulator
MYSWPESSLLGRLGGRARQELLSAGIQRDFEANDVLIHQGALDTYCMLLLTGNVKITALDESGTTSLLAIRTSGELVGETSALQDVSRTATVTACSRLSVRQLTGAELRQLMAVHRDLTEEVTSMVLTRLQWANQRRLDFTKAAPVRLARALVELVTLHGSPTHEGLGRTLNIPITQGELGSLAGVALPTVERTIGQLRRDGVVRWCRGNVHVTDLGRLRRFAELCGEIQSRRSRATLALDPLESPAHEVSRPRPE